MALVAVSPVVSKASLQLLDAGYVRWTEAELVGWFNQGQREITNFKPTAYVKVESVQLVAGPKQSLPDGGTELLNVTRNMGTDGATSGTAINMVPRQLLDDFTPSWQSGTAAATVKHYTYDKNNASIFYVYPPQPSSSQGYVELHYCATPPDATLGNNGVLDMEYEPALLNYVLYRAFSKDAEFSGNVALATSYYNQFLSAIGAATAEAKAA